MCHALGHSCRSHTKEWCIKPGGGIAGKTIDESKAAQKATQGGERKEKGANTSANLIKNGITVKGFDGHAYIVDTTHLQKIQLEQNEFAGIANSTNINTTDYFEYQGFIAMDDKPEPANCEPRVSVNWNTHMIPAIPGYETILATTSVLPSNPSSNT